MTPTAEREQPDFTDRPARNDLFARRQAGASLLMLAKDREPVRSAFAEPQESLPTRAYRDRQAASLLMMAETMRRRAGEELPRDPSPAERRLRRR